MIGAVRLCALLQQSARCNRCTGLVGEVTLQWRSLASATAQTVHSTDAAAYASAPKRDSVFVDRLRVRAVGGHGGSGAVSTWGSRAKGTGVVPLLPCEWHSGQSRAWPLVTPSHARHMCRQASAGRRRQWWPWRQRGAPGFTHSQELGARATPACRRARRSRRLAAAQWRSRRYTCC
jgi:hypothetical protein